MTDPVALRRTLPADAVVESWVARDGLALRVFTRPAPPGRVRGSLVFQGGRGDFIEKYLESLAHWHDRGWHVASFDWRWQGGSGRGTPAAHVGHIDDFAAYIGDLAEFWRTWSASVPGPRVAIGHSMGGHLILRALAERAIVPDAAVLVAPMLGLKAPIGAGVGAALARLLSSFGSDTRPAWKGNERPYTTTSRSRLLTHDTARYEDELWWQGRDAALLTGPPSWRWLTQAFASTRALAASPALAAMATPTLMLVAEADGLVDARAALALAKRLPDARTVRFGAESAHEILREVDIVRDRALAEIDAFLDSRAGPPA